MASRSSTSDIFILLLLVTACVVGLMAIWKIRFKEEAPAPTIIVQTEVQKPLPTPSPAPSTLQVTRPRATPPGMVCDGENVICVNKSYENMLLTNPFSVTGTIQGVDTSEWRWQILAANGGYVAEERPFEATSMLALRDFWVYPPLAGANHTGRLILYRMGSTGKHENILALPVRFSKERSTLSLSMVSGPGIEAGSICPEEGNAYQPYPRKLVVMKTLLPIEATAYSLAYDRAAGVAGVTTAVPEWMRIQSFSLENGTATIHFSKQMPIGVCLERSIRKQYEETLSQFSRVKKVEVIFE